MSGKVAMRSGRDRLRYTVTFELLLMAVLIPAGALFFHKPLTEIGVLSAVLAGKAMAINLVYNWLFDHVDARAGRVSSERSQVGRVLHAVGFEVTLMLTSLPLYMWWLQISLGQAFVTDLVVTTFVVGYTYVFTLAYDRMYPLRQGASLADGQSP